MLHHYIPGAERKRFISAHISSGASCLHGSRRPHRQGVCRGSPVAWPRLSTRNSRAERREGKRRKKRKRKKKKEERRRRNTRVEGGTGVKKCDRKIDKKKQEGEGGVVTGAEETRL